MISELIRVADARGLTGWDSCRERPIHWLIDLDAEGRVLGLSPTTVRVEGFRGELKERRGKAFKVPANYHTQWKDNKIQSVCTNQHNWLPDLLTGPVDEIFNDGVDGTNTVRHKRRLFWQLIFDAYQAHRENRTIRAIWYFLRSRPKFCKLALPADANLDWFRKGRNNEGENLSFRVCGRVAVTDSELREWWERRVSEQRNAVVKHLTIGSDLFLPHTGPITEYFPTVFGNVPFASFDKAPFRSYGLGPQTATFRLETAEKAAAALNALMGGDHTHLALGDGTAVFWAVERATGRSVSADFIRLLEQPDPLAVQDYVRGIWGTKVPEIATADFHVAILLKGTGRFSVRSWHTDTLAKADEHVRRYFEAITLPDDREQSPVLRDLAWATIARTRKQKTKPAPLTYNVLFEAAWRGTPLSFDLLAATIERQRVELASGDPGSKEFRTRLRARTALLQLYFALKPNNPFSATRESIIMNSKETAILCGRLLALLDEIHDKAHEGKSASSPANRLYGAASATPALAFPRLCQLARYHLQKMDAGLAYKLEFGVPKERRADDVPEDFEGLAAVVARLKEASGGDFPRMLSLEDQGRFALGFYYERARQWPNFKERQDRAENTQTGRTAAS